MRARRRPARWGAAALALACALAPAARADRADELARLRSAIAESRARVGEYEKEQRGLLNAVEALDQSAALLAREVATARQQAGEARARLEEIRAEAGRIEKALERTQRAMSLRAVALYKAGEIGALRLLFSASGLRDFLSRVSMLRLLLTHDAELLARHREQSRALARAQRETERAATEHEQALARLDERSRELGAERAAKRQMIRRLHASRSRERAALVELETAAHALEETLATLRGAPAAEQAPLAAPSFASLKGRLPLPVHAPIARDFGRVVDDEFRTETFRNGVDFAAARGTPVRAVAAADVRYAGWFRGYGRLVILDHGDHYFTVSGHLDTLDVAVGDRVAAGQSIGTVGDTGSLSGPSLYFEIRRDSVAQNPRDWLGAPD